MKRIIIETIPHDQQRYDTCGDWFTSKGDFHIKVSELQDVRYEALIAIHELVEATLCSYNGVTEAAVDAFDLSHEDSDNPGALPDAPYRNQHSAAEGVERLLAALLKVDWPTYDEAVKKLSK